MNYAKILRLSALVGAACWLVATGAASATTLDGAGGQLGAGTEIAFEQTTAITLHAPYAEIQCKKSRILGKTTNAGGANETVSFGIETFTIEECGTNVIAAAVLRNGSLEIHTKETASNNNGTVTSTNSEITFEVKVESANFHCIYKTSNTDIGTLTGTNNTGGAAVLDTSGKIPRTGGRSGAFCGSEAEWTGAYKITSPATLNVT